MGTTTQERLRDASQRVLEAARRFTTAPRRKTAGSASDLFQSLRGLRDDELVFLESRIRSWADYWFPGWKPIDRRRQLLDHRNPTVVSAALALATMGPDGFLRQEAIERIDLTEPLWSRLCVIRTTDWVPQVAQAAAERLQAVEAPALVRMLPLVALVDSRSRGGLLRATLDATLRSESGRAALIDTAVHGSGTASRLAWFELFRRHPDAAADRVEAGLRHPDIRVRQHALAHVDRLDEAARRDALLVLVRDPIGRLRAEALSRLFDASTPTVDSVLPHLEDRSWVVRAVAQHWLRRLGGDPAESYRIAVTERPTKWNVMGLTETGGANDVLLLEPLLTNQSETVRNAALFGMARLDRARAVDAARDVLNDQSARVCRTAISVLLTDRSSRTLNADLLLGRIAGEDRAEVRRALFHAVYWFPWHRLAAAAELSDDPDESTRLAAREALRRWPSEVAHVGTRPQGVAEREVARHLPDLEPELRRAVEFVLRTSRD